MPHQECEWPAWVVILVGVAIGVAFTMGFFALVIAIEGRAELRMLRQAVDQNTKTIERQHSPVP